MIDKSLEQKRTKVKIGDYYEFAVVTVNCDEDGVSVNLDGEPWGWEICDIDFFVRISR